MTPSDEPTALELQARLIADVTGEERRRLDLALAELRADIRQRRAVGAAPAEYRVLETVDRAAEAAEGVVALVWRRYHGRAA